jgi:8-oxo-dGTP diphosphatase
MARAPVLAAGGIVLRQTRPPQIAVVRLRKCNEWVLPKGKLDDGETPRQAAMREVLEETGHDVSVHEFLGTLAYDLGGRSKIVHYWRMEPLDRPVREPTNDVKAVDWLPLEAALDRLSRDHERAFLANVGPLALEAAKRSRERKPVATDKRRPRRAVIPKSSPTKSLPAMSPPLAPLSDETAVAAEAGQLSFAEHESGSFRPSSGPQVVESLPQVVRLDAAPPAGSKTVVETRRDLRTKLVRKVRNWLRRAA